MRIETITEQARQYGASDIHLVAGQPPILRRDGQMHRMDFIVSDSELHELILSLLPDYLRPAFENGEDADFAYKDADERRYRVNIFRQMGQLGCVMRLLAASIPTLDELSLPAVLKDLVMLPRGLVLVTGPTGSGKSTTLAAMIDHANLNRQSHIITVEDPVEYVHTCKNSIINQREVGRDVQSFSGALRSAMREDPDIILVGEMRDFETISAAITAAETGHLVLSTLHTTGAAKTIDRIIDVFPPHQQEQIRTQLASVLKGVITQQLVRKIGGGRCAAFEILIANDAIANMIREGKTHQINSAMQTGLREGMILLDKNLAELANQGVIEREEAQRACERPDELRRFLR